MRRPHRIRSTCGATSHSGMASRSFRSAPAQKTCGANPIQHGQERERSGQDMAPERAPGAHFVDRRSKHHRPHSARWRGAQLRARVAQLGEGRHAERVARRWPAKCQHRHPCCPTRQPCGGSVKLELQSRWCVHVAAAQTPLRRTWGSASSRAVQGGRWSPCSQVLQAQRAHAHRGRTPRSGRRRRAAPTVHLITAAARLRAG